MACMGVVLALCVRSVHMLGGCGGMLPQKNFGFLKPFLCIFEGKSEVSECLDGKFHLVSMIQALHAEQTSSSVAVDPAHL